MRNSRIGHWRCCRCRLYPLPGDGCGSRVSCPPYRPVKEPAARVAAPARHGAPRGNPTTSKTVDLAEDQFYWMNKINKASVVMLVEERILPRERGARSQGYCPHHRPGCASPTESGPPT